jgi:hypothetical protein
MSESALKVEVHGDLIVVSRPGDQFTAIYAKPIANDQLIPMSERARTESCWLEHGNLPKPKRVNVGGLPRL